MRFFQIYQYVVPLLLFPLAYWLWWRRYDHDHGLTILALSIPIAFSYVVPAVGTNWLKIWEFNTRLKIGRFRPQHGFVFGTATSLLGLVVLDYPRPLDLWDPLRAGFVMGSVLGFWNWWYDTLALRSGFLRVYNQAFGSGAGPEAVALQYCPIFFGAFGFCYGAAIRILELVLVQAELTQWYWPLWVGCHSVVLVLPVLTYIAYSKLTIGRSGLQSYDPSLATGSSSEPVIAGGAAIVKEPSP